MEKYVFIKEIGSGSFGKVFLVKSKQQGINYVVKQVDLTKLDRKQSQSATKEVEVLAKLKHYNVVSYKESYEKNNQLNIVLEFCENGDLHDVIKEKRLSNKFFGENEILDYFVQICLALEYIHGKRILHRDLKTKNIFLTKGNVIKLGDFGIAKVLENSFELAQTCIGSPFYVSPEICESKPYNKKSDIWALGCVLYELATLKYAFVAKNVKTLLTKILTGVYNPLPTNMNIHIRGLISVMLKPNPKDRPSVREILDKRFLLKRRATFICKAHQVGLDRRRSRSGDVSRCFPLVANNESKRNELKRGKLSLSCLQLNQLKDQRKLNSISNPETKYKPFNTNQISKADKKFSDAKNEGNSVQNEKRENSEVKNVFTKTKYSLKDDYKNKNSNFQALKNMKLPKVDSEYYNMIAGCGVEKKEADYQKPECGKKTEESFTKVEECNEGLKFSSPNDAGWEKIENEKNENEQRKRWVKNTLQRKELLAILSDSEILNGNLSLEEFPSVKSYPNASIDDMLSLEPSEISEDVLLPIKLYDNESNKKMSENNPFHLLQNEVKRLREKFELNDKTHQMEDLLRLTESSKKLINFDGGGVNRENDKKVGESVFYDLEYQKMTLEKKVGFPPFLKAYGEMINVINKDFTSNLKNAPENRINGTETYVISKIGVSDDSDDVIKKSWKSIVNFLGDKWEYLPDIWELAMSEHIYYHL